MTDVRLVSRGKARQKGAATLLVSIILLIAGTLVVLTGARTAVQEQQLAANDARARQALVAAQAGLDHAVAARRVSNTFGAAEDELQGLHTIGDAAYRVRFCAAEASPGPCPSSPNAALTCDAPGSGAGPLLIYACGWSDDRAARRPVTTISTRLESYGGAAALPLVARSAADLMEGNASIYNHFNDLTVWSGDSFLGQAMTGNTYIRNAETHPTPDLNLDLSQTGSCNNPPNGYICSSQGASVGHDVVTNDPTLANLSNEAFFAAFMGADFDTYREEIASVHLNDAGELGGISAESVWIDGDANIGETVGSREHPVVLVVEGNLHLGSNAEIYGIVYVTGELSGNGGPSVYGSMVVNGDAKASGNLNLIYDPVAVSNASRLGAATGAPGSWKDWVVD